MMPASLAVTPGEAGCQRIGNADNTSQALSRDQQVTGETQDGLSLQQVATSKKSNFNLEKLYVFPGHLEITGGSNGNVICNEIHQDKYDQAPSPLRRAYRAIMRTKEQKDAYRRGMENVRGWLLQKFDQNAVDRFDKNFAYRMWGGKPLTVRALESFLDEEKNLRLGTYNISSIELDSTKDPTTLEELHTALGPQAFRDSHSVIGGGKVPVSIKRYTAPLLPIARSWLESTAAAEDVRRGDQEGISESQKVIVALLSKDSEYVRKHIEHLFEINFANNKKTGKPLKVSELSSFVEQAIEIRNAESGVLGFLRTLIQEVSQETTDVEAAVGKFVKASYHTLGILAAASIVLDQTRNASDPIAIALKEIFAGGVVASENDTQRILTAVILSYLGSSAATQESWSASIIKSFIPFY